MSSSTSFDLNDFIRQHLDEDSSKIATYNILKYTADRYKVIYFPFGVPLHGLSSDIDRSRKGNEKKLSQAISRARKVVLELALCNDWEYFVTLTVAKNNFDRKNLDGWYNRFHEWIKGQRKVLGKKIPYLFVPEQHGDGSWHMHGFFNKDIESLTIPFYCLDQQGFLSDNGKKLPRKLIDNGYFDMPKYREKFGFCSLGRIKNRSAAAFYASKYISKSFSGDVGRVGLRLYYPSAGLNRSQYVDSVYGYSPDLHRVLDQQHEFCSTGFYTFDREPGFDPVIDIIEEQKVKLFPFSDLTVDDTVIIDDYFEFTQLAMEAFA